MPKADFGSQKLNKNQVIAKIHFIIWMLLVFLIYNNVLSPALKQEKSFGISYNNSVATIIDFPSQFNFAKEVWLSKTERNSASSVYSVENHLNVTNKWAGINVNHSLSFGYSPTMLWLLAPLVLLSHATAFCIFNLLGLLGIWWQTRPLRSRLGAGLLSHFSLLAYTCFQLGQTALLSGIGLLYVAEKTRNDQEIGRHLKSAFYTGTVLWCLTAKPPLAITAGAVLLALRKWQPVLFALILTAIMTLVISPLLGENWIYDYLTLLSTHNFAEADKAFAFSHFPPGMANLRAILNVDFKVFDNIASRISAIAWLCSLVWLMTAGARLYLQQAAYSALGILFYLLFCPHVSSTEELQLVLLIPLCVPAMKEKLNKRELTLFVLIPLLPFMSPAVGPFFLNVRWGLFAAKLFLVFFVVYNCGGRDQRSISR